MNAVHKWGACVLALCLVCAVIVPAQADPLPGEIEKFDQHPQDGTALIPGPNGTVVPWPYFGHDEESSAYFDPLNPVPTYVTRPGGQFMADDFEDKLGTPVVHVQWWGSYLNNSNRGAPPAVLPNRFLIAWESDVPAGPTPSFSRPGSVIQSEIVTLAAALTPGSGTYTETPWAPAPAGSTLDDIFVYNAELHCPFPEQPDTIYWLKIVALFDNPADPTGQPPPVIWGWHNRDYTKPASGLPTVPPTGEFDGTVFDPSLGYAAPVFHYLDDAVSGFMAVQTTADPCLNLINQTGYAPQNYVFPSDGPDQIQNHSKDLAFALYTIPEPSSLILMGLGVVALVVAHARKGRTASLV